MYKRSRRPAAKDRNRLAFNLRAGGPKSVLGIRDKGPALQYPGLALGPWSNPLFSSILHLDERQPHIVPAVEAGMQFMYVFVFNSSCPI